MYVACVTCMFPDHACLDHVVTCMSGPYLEKNDWGGRTWIVRPKATARGRVREGGAKLKLPPFFQSEWEAKKRSINNSYL